MVDQPTNFYILFSQSLNKYYIGITTEEMPLRLEKHNSAFHGNHFTSTAKDWTVQLVIPCETYSIARKMELYVKRMKSRKFIEKIINDQTQKDLLLKTIKSI